MSENPRDTQFQGFASLLLGEMLQASKTYSGLIDSESGAWQEVMQQIIAHRAYDLVMHAFAHTSPSNIADIWYSGPADVLQADLAQAVSKIPDLTEWPDEGKKGL